ncbi:MAG TPA: hypothetical protein GX405_15890 [Rhizobiales bacterium]|nr:hypothetical protein [Hyphomicrobiales bacterium]
MAKRGNKSRQPARTISLAYLPARPGWRLPVLAPPVVRGPKSDPAHWGIGASDINCEACIARCSLLEAPLRSICEELCAATCSR